MAEISKSGTPSPSVTLYGPEHVLAGLLAGEAIAAGDVVYIKSDGLAWLATGAAANAAAKARGFAAKAASTGGPVTILNRIRWNYGASLTPGAEYYLSGTAAGGLADAASTGGTVVIAYAVDATRIQTLI